MVLKRFRKKYSIRKGYFEFLGGYRWEIEVRVVFILVLYGFLDCYKLIFGIFGILYCFFIFIGFFMVGGWCFVVLESRVYGMGFLFLLFIKVWRVVVGSIEF